MAPHMISSLELARLCGVSQGTVDRALHDRPGINQGTRVRILAMARQHGYVPNPAARELMGLSTSSMAAVIMPDVTVQIPFMMDLIAEIGRHLRPLDVRLSLWPTPDEDFPTAIEEIAARRPRALIMLLAPETLTVSAHVSGRLPVLALLLPNRSRDVVSLVADEHAIGSVATRHLLERGHRRIAHLAPSLLSWKIDERRAGYAAAMRAANCEPLMITGEIGAATVHQVRAAGCTAVFCYNDPSALAFISHAQLAGWAVPRDCSVIGVDHSPTIAALDPTLSSVAYPFAGIAAQVAAVLGGTRPPPLAPPEVAAGSTVAALER